jgi:hypothetical protein
LVYFISSQFKEGLVHMVSRILLLFVTLAGMTATAIAQQACSAVEVPVGVINAGGETFRGLTAQDFIASKGATVKSIAYDNGPRRVLFVVDTSPKLSSNTHAAAAELVKTLIESSRPEDSLALITARGPGGAVKFGDDRAGLVRALIPEAGTDHKKQGVLDAMMEGIDWFSAPQPGDAIVLIAADLDGNHKANSKTVAKAAADHHLRLFGLALGPVITASTVAGGTMTSTSSQGGLASTKPMTGEVLVQEGDEHFFPLVVNSGGLVLAVVNAKLDQSNNVSEPRVQEQVRYKAKQLFAMISVFYRAQVESPALSRHPDWTLEVNEKVRKSGPAMFLLYPRELGPC